MKRLQSMIIVIASIIVILIISIIIIKKNVGNRVELANNISNDEVSNNATENDFIQSDKISRLEYTVVSKAATTYIQTINKNNSMYLDINSNNETQYEERNKYILNLLSQSYITKNKINNNNLEQHIKLLEEQLFFVPLIMKRVQSGEVKTYVVEGITINMSYEFKGKSTLIINIDYENKTFSIEPTVIEYNEINTVDVISNIDKKNNNGYSTKDINVENIIKDYMNNLKRMMLAKPEIVYEYLDEEYRNKRFGSLDNFKEYIKKNLEEIKEIYIDKYLFNKIENYSQYIGVDKYNNMYIFNERDPLNYTILLDTYTINSDKFKKAYDESDNKYKVKMNVDKWIKMINNRDYETAYKCLDETFRNNNFASEEEFEKYMREKFPLHYKLSVGSTEEVNGLYKQRIILEDITGVSDEKIENTIIMQLKDNYEFVMSFGIE